MTASPTGRSVTAGPWLAETLAGLRAPEGLAAVDPGPDLHGTLRPYQQIGVHWLQLLSRLGLGACLADDMGLGKTIQVLALLLVRKRAEGRGRRACWWCRPRCSPTGRRRWSASRPPAGVLIVHPSAMPAEAARCTARPSALAGLDLVITSYGSLLRIAGAAETALAAVRSSTRRRRSRIPARQADPAAKALKAGARIALTGTPVENHLGDLWSSSISSIRACWVGAKQFSQLRQAAGRARRRRYGPLRELVRPYILRRMKTDKAIIADLPDKTEMKA